MMEKVFLGNLAGDVNEGTLRKLLEQQGIIFNNISMKRNFAFVTVKDKLSVEEVVKKLNGYTLEGSIMQAEPSNGRRSSRRTNKIQIRNLPRSCTKEQIEELVSVTSRSPKKFEQVGSEGIMYVTFNTPEEAEECVEQLNDYRFEDGTQIKVDFFRNPRRSNRSNSNSNSGIARQDLPLRIVVASDYIGAVIGKQGQTIRKITSESRARVDIHRRESHVPDTLVTIKGSPESCSKACKEIMAVVRQEADLLNRGDVPFRILCPNSICGRIIGKQGNVIKIFMEKTNTNIVVSSFDPFPGGLIDSGNSYVDRVITITGSTENCSAAEEKISEKMRQCFEQDASSFQFGAQQHMIFSGMPGLPMMPGLGPYQGMRPPLPYMGAAYYPGTFSGPPQIQQQPEVVQLYIPEKSVGAVIGSKGQNIKNIMRLSGARIKILGANDKNGSGENNPFSHSGDERKAVISGSPEAQWKAQFYIFEKVKNELRLAAHDEVHLRTEIMVPKQSIGRIIGKGGQNVKEMQRVSGAIVQLPMEEQGDVDEVPVTIIGHFYATQSAQRRVRSLMNTLSRAQPAPRRTRPGAPQQLI